MAFLAGVHNVPQWVRERVKYLHARKDTEAKNIHIGDYVKNNPDNLKADVLWRLARQVANKTSTRLKSSATGVNEDKSKDEVLL